MASLSTKVLELACFFGASETKKDQVAISSVAANKDGELFATGVYKTLKVYVYSLSYSLL